MRRLVLTFHGRVQGVGFRAFVLRHAREHGLDGEVRNTFDGGVHVDAEGDPTALEAFLMDVRNGPSMARVEQVETLRGEASGRHRGFHITG